jgi:hypothetical protein
MCGYIYIYIYIHVCVCVCVRACVRGCVCGCTCNVYVYVNIHTQVSKLDGSLTSDETSGAMALCGMRGQQVLNKRASNGRHGRKNLSKEVVDILKSWFRYIYICLYI